VSLAGLVKYFRFQRKSGLKDTGEKVVSQPSFVIKEIEDLNNTEWGVKFTSAGGSKSFADTLSFVNGKFVSARFYQDGFKPTNYSVTQENNKIIWETMQTSGEATISWRGEITANKMRGVASLRSKEKSEDFSFVSLSLKRKK